MLQMLPEVIRPEELLSMIALSKFVHFLQMCYPYFPVLLCSYGDWGTCNSGGRDP